MTTASADSCRVDQRRSPVGSAATLKKVGLATGEYEQRPDDSLQLQGVLIANAVACVPPQNKPTTHEIKTCRQFIGKRLAEQRAPAYLALGRIAHDQLLVALGEKRTRFAFAHGVPSQP